MTEGLLRVDAVAVDLARSLERRLDGALGDLVDLDPVGILELECLGEVPRDGLALPIRVGGEQDFVGLLDRVAQLPDLLLLAPDDRVLGTETVRGCAPSKP